MTIEAQLKEIHEELVKLNAKFSHIGAASGHNDDAERTAVQAKRDAAGGKPPKAEKKADEEKGDGAKPAIPYDKLSAAIKSKAAKNRAAVVAVLGEFKVKNAQELKPEQYAEVLAKIEAIQ